MPSAKPRPRKKRLIRQPSAATFSHRRRHICTPACSCFLLPVAKRHEGTEFHSGGVKEPECARAAARQGDRGAVDEECALFPADLPSTIQSLFPRGRPSVARFCTFPLSPFSRLHIDFRYPPVGVGAPTTRTTSFQPTFRQQYNHHSPSLRKRL